MKGLLEMSFDDIINKEELRFEDRENIIDDIKMYYQQMMSKKPFFQIVSISGMGGIGKSRLLNQLKFILQKTYPDDSNQKIIFLTLEIANSDYFLNALVKLRSQINQVCPLFDYAFLTYWRQSQVSKLDESFMNIFKHQWLDWAKTIGGAFSIPIKIASLSIDTLLEILDKSFGFIKEKYYATFFNNHSKDISEYSTDELKECLSGFLGIDMNRIYCEKNLCVFIDSYERYPSSKYVDWLMDLMEQANTGLFIISGREEILFPDVIVKHTKPKLLEPLPDENVKALLREYIPDIDNTVIQHIITTSENLPIYLDLAVATYKNVTTNGQKFDKNTFFMYRNKEDITRKFFNHLRPDHQKFLMTLSFLQLFDQETYSFIISLCPNSSIEDYRDFQLLTIISAMENDHDFYKVHDVINTNVIKILDLQTRDFLFQKYLEHIVSKTILYATDTQKIILYKHIIKMIKKNKFVLDQHKTELLLDLFFSLKQTLHTLLLNNISDFDNYEPLKEIHFFTKAIANEREDTLKRLEYLQNIDFEHNMFGKHQKSLSIIYGFLMQWTGDSIPLCSYLSSAYPSLNDEEIREWYYAQTVIFWADHLTIIGKFEEAKKVLQLFQDKLQLLPEQENSIFQAKRHMGHLLRFNMFLEDANNVYLSTRDRFQHFKNAVQEIYIVTNICETNCYLNPEIVFKYCYGGLRLGKNLKDLKSQAKIYYSMGIANIHKKRFKRCRKYIRKSMYLNILDGYKLGVIFSSLADIYLQFATRKTVRGTTLIQQLSKAGVYGFQALPLALIEKDMVQIRVLGAQYEWLDYSRTVAIYKKFLDAIRF